MLRKVFASFSIACLIFSASVLPCLAEEFSNEIAVTAGIGDRDTSAIAYYHVSLPFTGRTALYSQSFTTFTKQPMTVHSAYYAPKPYDRTLYVAIGIENDTAGYDSWFNGQNNYTVKPTVYYADSRDPAANSPGLRSYPNGVTAANAVYTAYGEAGEIFNYKVTVPAYSNSFEFDSTGLVLFTTQATPWHIVSYGGYVVDTADDSVLGIVEQILADTSSIDVNIGNLVSAINDILAQLRSIGADTSTMVEVLGTLEDLSVRQLDQLELIANNTEAIYYFLTEALKTESDAMQEAAFDATNKIENNSSAEAYYQASMQGSYDRVDLENFNLTFMDSSLELIATIFGDMWLSFGQWKIIFTFPLFLGVALLVIGRISRTGGGNSSRNSEHKGGEGGA